MKEITLETKISELLNDYEGMQDILININPKFKKLNNPVLRRTLAKVAGVRQAAIVGGMEPQELLNKLRVAVGQDVIEINVQQSTDKEPSLDAPEWINKEAKVDINANTLLEKQKNPLAESLKILKSFHRGEILTVEADFQPEPLIEEFEKSGHTVYCKEIEKDRFITYVKKY